MNERIQELCRHAGFIGEGFHNTVPGTCQETALNNFAELLIEECVRLVDANCTLQSLERGVLPSESICNAFGVK